MVAFRAAMEERTRERVPIKWAMSLGNQGVAMMRLAERKNDAAMARMAVGQINAAYEVLQSGGHGPLADFYRGQIPAAKASVERLGGGSLSPLVWVDGRAEGRGDWLQGRASAQSAEAISAKADAPAPHPNPLPVNGERE